MLKSTLFGNNIPMIIFLRIAVAVYFAAINFYSFLLVKKQRDDEDMNEKQTVKDGKIVLTSLLGGAAGVYISLLVFRYRLDSLLLMVFTPIFLLFNVFIAIYLFASNFFIPMPAETAKAIQDFLYIVFK